MCSCARCAGQRVLVTGMGVVSPIGADVEEFWAAQLMARSGIREITRFDASSLPVRIAGEVCPAACVAADAPEAAQADRCSQLALAAAGQAIRDSGLAVTEENSSRVAVVMGSGLGGAESLGTTYASFLAKGIEGVAARFIPMHMINHAAASIALRYGAQGPCTTVGTACASGADALIIGHQLIATGRADVVIAGGADAPVVPHIVAGFARLGALSTRNDQPGSASRPFAADRDGFVIAEGAGVLVLESERHAIARGAAGHAVFAGYGQSCDAYHMLRPHPDARGAIRAITEALRLADIDPADVGYVNAHGTSTRLNDLCEAHALRSVFGNDGADPLVSATKSLIGHTFGAAGAIEAISTIQTLTEEIAPPTANLGQIDEGIQLNLVTAPEPMRSRYALSNSFGFGGHNSVLAFERCEIDESNGRRPQGS
jgi:3-oxoacyl-[acyl-carrier-protein] synthase II